MNEFWRAGPTPSRRAAPGVRLRPSTSSRNGHRALPGRKTTTQKNLTRCFFSLCPWFDGQDVWHTQLAGSDSLKKTNKKNKQPKQPTTRKWNAWRYQIEIGAVVCVVFFFFSLLFPHSFTTLHNRLELSCREPVPFFISCCFCFFLGGSYQRDWK